MTILSSVKKLLGVEEDYTQFDQDIIMLINMALNTLTQLGVGPEKGFKITDGTEVLQDFIGEDNPMFEQVIPYLYLRTRIIFDPPTSSFVLEAYKEEIKQLECRLNYQVDPPGIFEEKENE